MKANLYTMNKKTYYGCGVVIYSIILFRNFAKQNGISYERTATGYELEFTKPFDEKMMLKMLNLFKNKSLKIGLHNGMTNPKAVYAKGKLSTSAKQRMFDALYLHFLLKKI